jgi:hypothetical protein
MSPEAITKSSPYHSEEGAPKLLRSVTGFVDVLGYSEQIKEAFKAGQGMNELLQIKSALQEAGAHLRERQTAGFDMRMFEVRFFTDNIVIGEPIPEHGRPIGTLLNIITYLGWFQSEMACRGYFVRGAVSAGELYIDQEIVFGPALLEAVEGEKVADNPRIILTDSAFALIQDDFKTWIGGAPDYLGVLVDSDGRAFIDYLEESVMIARDEVGPYTELVHRQKAQVEKALSKFAGCPKIRTKYEWVAAYHNYFCDKYHFNFGAAEKIDPALFGPKFSPVNFLPPSPQEGG